MDQQYFKKLHWDVLFLTVVNAKQRIIILSEKDVFDLCQKEKNNGRVLREIEFVHAKIPEGLKKMLGDVKKGAAQEVTKGEK